MRAIIRCASAALLLAAAGCAPPGPQPQQGFVSLPPDAVQGAGDPTRTAILNAAYAFGSPASLNGRPAEAARAVAQLEFLASEIPSGARWREFDPTVGLELRGARQEARAALGIAPEAPTQAVVDALLATSRALGAGTVRQRSAPGAARLPERPADPAAAVQPAAPARREPGDQPRRRGAGPRGPDRGRRGR